MAGTVVTVHSEQVKQILSSTTGKAFTARIRSASAQSVRNGLVDHFRARQAEGNARGWQDKGFWDSNRGDAVTKQIRRPMVEGDATIIAIDSPALAHKITGGDVKPTGGRRYLAIPETQEAYLAESVRSHLGGRLAFVYGLYKDGSWRPALAATDNYLKRITRGRQAGQERLARRNERASSGGGAVQFWLVRSVRHKPDARALPPTADLAEAASSAAIAELSLILEELRSGKDE